MVAGCYKIPNIHVDVTGVYTNTAMVDAYRGAGRPGGDVRHRAGLRSGRGRHRASIRPRCGGATSSSRRTSPTTPASACCPTTAATTSRRSTRRWSRSVTASSAPSRSDRRDNGDGKLLGIGLSSYVEVCGVAPSKWIGLQGEGWGAGLWESANVRVHLTGKVVGHDRLAAARPGPRDDLRATRRPTSSACPTTTSRSSTPTRTARRSVSAPTAAGRWRSAAPRSTRASQKVDREGASGWRRTCWKRAERTSSSRTARPS